jgi:hypothetical protein
VGTFLYWFLGLAGPENEPPTLNIERRTAKGEAGSRAPPRQKGLLDLSGAGPRAGKCKLNAPSRPIPGRSLGMLMQQGTVMTQHKRYSYKGLSVNDYDFFCRS